MRINRPARRRPTTRYSDASPQATLVSLRRVGIPPRDAVNFPIPRCPVDPDAQQQRSVSAHCFGKQIALGDQIERKTIANQNLSFGFLDLVHIAREDGCVPQKLRQIFASKWRLEQARRYAIKKKISFVLGENFRKGQISEVLRVFLKP